MPLCRHRAHDVLGETNLPDDVQVEHVQFVVEVGVQEGTAETLARVEGCDIERSGEFFDLGPDLLDAIGSAQVCLNGEDRDIGDLIGQRLDPLAGADAHDVVVALCELLGDLEANS